MLLWLSGEFETRSVVEQVDLWLRLIALVACMETLGVCWLATWKYARKVYNVKLQRWTMRIILIGPVYSCLMWVSLWTPSLDLYIAIPVGFYEAYAFFCFYALLVCFADGEDRVVLALGNTAYIYGRGRLPVYRFGSARDLVRFLKFGVTQAMIVKPLNVVLMLLVSRYSVDLANYSRVLSIASFWLVANSLTQVSQAVLPRIRGLGGERLYTLLLFMIIVIIVQDIVISILLVHSHTDSATDEMPTRLIFYFTIIEFTVFATIFYRLLPPDKFGHIAWANSNQNLMNLAPPNAISMPLCTFIAIILDPTTMFQIPATREARCPPEYDDGVYESKDDEYSPLIKSVFEAY